MKVTTKRGDTGMTDLFGGIRVPKSNHRIELIGVCDEIQSLIGIVKNLIPEVSEQTYLTSIQKAMYQAMAEFAGAQKVPEEIITEWINDLEKQEALLLKKTPIGTKFVIPGSSLIEAWYQFARTRVRSFERYLVLSTKKFPTYAKFVPFFNRLSDYFFILGQAHGLSQKDVKV